MHAIAVLLVHIFVDMDSWLLGACRQDTRQELCRKEVEAHFSRGPRNQNHLIILLNVGNVMRTESQGVPVLTRIPAFRSACVMMPPTSSISSKQFLSLPNFTGTSPSRLQSLYSDISRQKHSNPTSYQSNVSWWRATLEAIVAKGWQPNSFDKLVLHVDQSLPDYLRYEGTGKPLCLGTVIVSPASTFTSITCHVMSCQTYRPSRPDAFSY